MNAYNYGTQTWVDGSEGTRCLLAQLQSELAILSGPNAAAFLRYSLRRGQLPVTVTEARLAVETQIAEMTGTLRRELDAEMVSPLELSASTGGSR